MTVTIDFPRFGHDYDWFEVYVPCPVTNKVEGISTENILGIAYKIDDGDVIDIGIPPSHHFSIHSITAAEDDWHWITFYVAEAPSTIHSSASIFYVEGPEPKNIFQPLIERSRKLLALDNDRYLNPYDDKVKPPDHKLTASAKSRVEGGVTKIDLKLKPKHATANTDLTLNVMGPFPTRKPHWKSTGKTKLYKSDVEVTDTVDHPLPGLAVIYDVTAWDLDKFKTDATAAVAAGKKLLLSQYIKPFKRIRVE